jgi:hypothetical protein
MPSCSSRPSLGSGAGGGFNNVHSVVISLARAGRVASTVQCCSALRPEACICKLGSGPLRERALRSDAADAIIDERNLLRHTDMKDRSPVMMRLQMLAHVSERCSWNRGCPLPWPCQGPLDKRSEVLAAAEMTSLGAAQRACARSPASAASFRRS